MSKTKTKLKMGFIKSLAAFSLAAILALSGWAGGAASVSASEKTHVVRSGESWWLIGNRYSVNYNLLASHNGRSASQTIYAGETLRIPGTRASAPATAPSSGAGQRTHTVVRGESWWLIGNRYGVNYNVLASHNGFSSSATLHIGQVLKIPGTGAAAAPAPAPVQTPAPSSIGGARMVQFAAKEVGNSNWRKYIGWYNNNPNHYWYDWCTVFVSYVANQAGYMNSTTIPKNSFVPELRADFARQGRLYDKYSITPQPGDIAFFNRHGYSAGDTRTSHAAIVERVEGNTVYTIEGNRGGGTGSVVRMSHRINGDYLASFGRPNYR